MNVVLPALDPSAQVSGPKGARSILIADFHRLPGSTAQVDTVLLTAELITSVHLPPPLFARHVRYVKVRERSS